MTATEREQGLPSIDEIAGSDPEFTGGLSTEARIHEMRGRSEQGQVWPSFEAWARWHYGGQAHEHNLQCLVDAWHARDPEIDALKARVAELTQQVAEREAWFQQVNRDA